MIEFFEKKHISVTSSTTCAFQILAFDVMKQYVNGSQKST